MVLQTKREELFAAWRALKGRVGNENWRTIPVVRNGPYRMLAGRHFPGNEEALLVGFTSIHRPTSEQLPQGRGFGVSEADVDTVDDERTWIALCRQRAGDIELFAMMAEDIIATIERSGTSSEERLFSLFLSRIRAWQEFMRMGTSSILSAEAEIGLFGELEILSSLIDTGLSSVNAVEAWQGPLDGVQDFMLGMGAIEVKSTVSPSGFPASISSLEQLDDSLTRPLFLAGVRFSLSASGITLPQQVFRLRQMMQDDPVASDLFDIRLIHAGYLDAVSESYTRRFTRVEKKVLAVSDHFPRLTRANVSVEIRRARYEIDLDLIASSSVSFKDALNELGVI